MIATPLRSSGTACGRRFGSFGSFTFELADVARGFRARLLQIFGFDIADFIANSNASIPIRPSRSTRSATAFPAGS
jgi:hypothetical protein